jgi:glyoxylase-like metal-dependent hydrolase (beta-lactamase superfamily II)
VIHRAGSEIVNFYLLEEGGRVTVVDAGCPAYLPHLERALGEIGRTLSDVEAIVLTHAHIDHVGFSQALQDQRGTPVYAHEGEVAQATTGKPPSTEGSLISALRHRTARRVIFHIARHGGARPPKVARVQAFKDGDDLDVPGRPRAIATHGHSPGHCALYVEQEGALFAGDALCGWNTVTGQEGPILPPPQFSHSMQQARASLQRIAALPAQTLYFGHGEPWRNGAEAAVSEARARDGAG